MPVTKEFFGGFSTGVMLLCAVMALVWIVRIRSRGFGACAMVLAFLMLGGLTYALRVDAPTWTVVTLGIGLAVCLAADFVLRLARPRQ